MLMKKLSVSGNGTTVWIVHIIICSLYITLMFSSSDFVLTPMASFADAVYAVMHWSVIFIAFTSVLFIISFIHRYLLYAVYSLVCLLSAILTYFKYSIGFSFNTMILDIIFANDITVSADMVTLPLVAYTITTTAIGIVLAVQSRRYRINYKSPVTYIALALSIIGSITMLGEGRFQRPIAERIPFNIVFVSSKYLEQKEVIAVERPRQCTYARTADSDTTIVVAVIGEALRPSNLSINGYHRSTTPKMESLDVVSFDSVYSDFVYTNKSVPHLMTRADRNNPERAYNERSFIDVYKCAGIPTAVISNQDAEKHYAYFINEADTTIRANISKTPYNFDKWLDGDILPHYNSLLQHDGSQLIVIHTIGSHWWYCSHFTDEYAWYTPIIKSRIVNQSDSMHIVNSYDNTVVYTDYVLSGIIEPLKEKNAIVLYLSDHGEQLGENGQWLHASESEIMQHTASLVWMSDKYKRLYPERYDYVLENRHNQYLTDYFYHTVIEAGNIGTDVLDTTMSLFHKHTR